MAEVRTTIAGDNIQMLENLPLQQVVISAVGLVRTVDLASRTDSTKGSGQTGHDPSLSYDADSVGGALRRIINVPNPTGGDDTTIIQAAASALASGDTLRFCGKPYVVNTGASVVISVPGVTIDFNGSSILAATTNSVPAFALIPASLVASGRLTGADFPSNWKNGSTPLPMDNDFDTMMHEHNSGSRLSNIVIKNAKAGAGCNRTFLKAYSVDGLTFTGCSIEPTGVSAVRVHHSSEITADKSNLFGGSGTYVFFGLKCQSPNIDARFRSTTAIRALSFKGVMHPIGTSIFASFGSTHTDFNGRFGGTIFDGLDGVFWDSTPSFTEDAVGARGGAAIGFTSGTWYGKGRGLSVVGARISLPSCNPGSGGAQGRGVWVSAPHQDVLIASTGFRDAIVFATGVVAGACTGNKFFFTKGVGYAIEVQGDSTASTDALYWDVEGNRVYSWQPIGSIVAPLRAGFTSGTFNHNSVFQPAIGTASMVAWAGNFSGNSDHVIAEGNRLFHSLATAPTFGSFGSNNSHGWASNNLVHDTSNANPTASTGVRTRDNGGGTGFSVTLSDDATGFGGFGCYTQNGVTLKAQNYWDASLAEWITWVGAKRARVTSAGTSFLTGMYPPKDDGAVQANCRLFAGSGAPSNANGNNGDFYFRSDTPGTANQRVYTRSAGAWVGIL